MTLKEIALLGQMSERAVRNAADLRLLTVQRCRCPLDNCPIMLRASLLAYARILPQARQGSYFFNRIGQKQTIRSVYKAQGDSKY